MGFILDAIGAAASAGGEIMGERRRADMQAERDTIQNDRHEQQAIRMAQFNDELQAKRQETVDRLKRERDELHQKKLTDQGDKIVTQGAEIGKKRDVSAMTAGAAGLPSEGEFAGKPIQSSDIENLPPAARKIYEEQGFLPKRTGSGLVADQMTAARSMGADPTLRSDLQKEYASTLGNEQKEAADAQATRKADDAAKKSERTATETEKHNRAMEALKEKRDADIAKAAMVSASKTASQADKQAATGTLSTIIRDSSKEIKDLKEELMVAKKGSDKEASILADIASATKSRDLARKNLDAKLSGDDSPRAEAAKPKADAGTKGGASAPPADRLKENVHTTFANKQVWTLKNGKPVQVK